MWAYHFTLLESCPWLEYNNTPDILLVVGETVIDIFSGEVPDEHLNNFLSCFWNLGSLQHKFGYQVRLAPYLH